MRNGSEELPSLGQPAPEPRRQGCVAVVKSARLRRAAITEKISPITQPTKPVTRLATSLSSPIPAAALTQSARPEPPSDLAACLARVRRQDEDAARELVGHLYPLVTKIVRAHLSRRFSEEDLAQVVFMKIFANLDQYAGKVPFEHWVSRVAVNTCLNQLRADKIRPELLWTDLSDEEAHVIESLRSTAADLDPGQFVAARELVDKLLGALNAEDRLLLRLLHLEGRSVAEVRQITGWNVPVIKVRAFRARGKLRKHFAKLMEQTKQ